MNWKDPIVEETRKNREAIVRRSGGDSRALLRELMKVQQANAHRTVSLAPAQATNHKTRAARGRSQTARPS